MTHPATSRLRWYAQRARQMSPAEMAWRARDQALQLAWARRKVSPADLGAAARLRTGPRWSLHRGQTDPILGWYSSGLGRRVPAFTLLGRGRSAASEPFRTRLEFVDAEIREESPFTRSAVSWGASNARGQKMRGN